MDIRPALPVAVDDDPTRVRIDKFGVRHKEYEFVYTEYDAGRIRAGYCCIECGEPQVKDGMPLAFPEHCSACHYPMRREQAHRFAESFEGYTHVGPSRTLEELRAEDDGIKEQVRREREGKPTSSIWLPS